MFAGWKFRGDMGWGRLRPCLKGPYEEVDFKGVLNFDKLSTYYVPGTVLGTGNATVNKTNSCLHKTCVRVGKQTSIML